MGHSRMQDGRTYQIQFSERVFVDCTSPGLSEKQRCFSFRNGSPSFENSFLEFSECVRRAF